MRRRSERKQTVRFRNQFSLLAVFFLLFARCSTYNVEYSNKKCNDQGECIDGWLCNENKICVLDKCVNKNESYTDHKGQKWDPVWVCYNDHIVPDGIPLYSTPCDAANVEGYLKGTKSWFACYTHGDYHNGTNDVWYYTRGKSKEGTNKWGYLPSTYVQTGDIHPHPIIPPCMNPPEYNCPED